MTTAAASCVPQKCPDALWGKKKKVFLPLVCERTEGILELGGGGAD